MLLPSRLGLLFVVINIAMPLYGLTLEDPQQLVLSWTVTPETPDHVSRKVIITSGIPPKKICSTKKITAITQPCSIVCTLSKHESCTYTIDQETLKITPTITRVAFSALEWGGIPHLLLASTSDNGLIAPHRLAPDAVQLQQTTLSSYAAAHIRALPAPAAPTTHSTNATSFTESLAPILPASATASTSELKAEHAHALPSVPAPAAPSNPTKTVTLPHIAASPTPPATTPIVPTPEKPKVSTYPSRRVTLPPLKPR